MDDRGIHRGISKRAAFCIFLPRPTMVTKIICLRERKFLMGHCQLRYHMSKISVYHEDNLRRKCVTEDKATYHIFDYVTDIHWRFNFLQDSYQDRLLTALLTLEKRNAIDQSATIQ